MGIFDKVKHEIEHGLNSLGDGIKRDIRTLGISATAAIKDAENDGLHSLKQAGADIEHEGQQLLTDIKSAGLAAAAKEVLETAYAMAEAVEPDQIQLTLGPVIIEVDDIPSRMAVLKRLAEHPPHSGKSIVAAIRALEAGSVAIQGDVGLGFIVQSDDAKIGVQLTWQTDSVIDRLEELLHDHFGI